MVYYFRQSHRRTTWYESGFFFFFFFFFAKEQHTGSQFPDQGWKPCSLQWKPRILTTAPQGCPSKGNFTSYVLKESTIFLLRLYWQKLSFNQSLLCYSVLVDHQPSPVVAITDAICVQVENCSPWGYHIIVPVWRQACQRARPSTLRG